MCRATPVAAVWHAAVRAEVPLKRVLDRGVVIGIVLMIVLTVAYGVVAYRTTSRMGDDARWVAHTYEVRGLISGVLVSLADAEAAQRNYLLTGQSSYLAPYDDAKKQLETELLKLRGITGDNAAQQDHLSRLERVISSRIATLDEGIELRRASGEAAARQFVLGGKGRAQMDSVRALIDVMAGQEHDLLTRRQKRWSESYLSAVLSGPSAALFGLLLIAAFAYLIVRGFRDRFAASTVIEEQAERLRVTLASIGDAVIAADVNGRATFLNPVAEELTGWSGEEARGRPLSSVYRILDERTREAIENPVERVLRQGASDPAGHAMLVARDGSERPIDDSAAPILDERGQIAGVVLVFRDVTVQRRERHARAERARLTSLRADVSAALASNLEVEEVLQRCCNAMLTHLELETATFWSVNDETRALERRALAGAPTPEAAAQRRVPIAGSLLGRVVQSGEPIVVGEGFEAVGDGHEPFPAGAFVAHPATVEGRVVGVIAVSAAEGALEEGAPELKPLAAAMGQFLVRREAEQALSANRDRLEFALAVAGMGAWELDLEDGSAIWSRTCYDLLGRDQDEAEPTLQMWKDAMHPDDWESVLSAIERARRERQRFQPEFRVVHAITGQVRWIAAFGRIANDAHGAPNRLSGIFMDITVRRQAEEALKDIARRKDEFLAVLAHELRNPLAPMRNGLEIMRQVEMTDERLIEVRDMLQRQVDQMTRLVDDLLDVSRINQGKVAMRKATTRLSDVIEGALEISRPLFDARRQTVDVSMSAEPLFLDADRVRLMQVVANLLNNASKYTPEEGRISLTVGREESMAAIRIRDTGIGIDAAMLKRVFEMFAQGPGHTAHDGLGVGLALVRGLVAGHGGMVTVSSDGVGRGSEFVVRLPLLQHVPEEIAPAKAEEPPAVALRILVVDDNEDSATSIAMLLRFSGHEVTTAHDGPTALDVAVREHPDVALLDVGLPGMDGHQVAMRIRSMPELKGVTLIAMTGYGQEEDRRRSREAGFDAHLVKPVDLEDLRRLLAGVRPRPGRLVVESDRSV